MKPYLLALSVLSGVAAAQCPAPKPFQAVKESDKATYAYNAIVAPLKPDETTSNENKHVPKVVNLWATWCAPCRKELPLLAAVADAGTATVELINIDDTEADAQNLLNSLNINKLKTYFADYGLLSTLSVAGLPATVVYTPTNTYLGVGIIKDETEFSTWLTCLQQPKTTLTEEK